MIDSVTVTICDDWKHLFEKFYQVDTSHAVNDHSRCLALVRRIIDISSGQIPICRIFRAASIMGIINVQDAFRLSRRFSALQGNNGNNKRPFQLCIGCSIPS